MANTKKDKKKKPWYLGWGPVIILCILVWPVGMIMLFLKATDIRKEKEASIPQEVFLSYSKDKTEEENTQAVKRERSTLNTIKMTKLIVPLIILVAGADLTLKAALLLRSGWQRDVWMDAVLDVGLLGAAAVLAVVCYRMSQRQKRFYRYMGIIGSSQSISIKSICRLTGYETEQVMSDLLEMQERLYFSAGAHVQPDTMVFYRSGKE